MTCSMVSISLHLTPVYKCGGGSDGCAPRETQEQKTVPKTNTSPSHLRRPSSYRARAARAATPTQLATTLPAPEVAAEEEVELLEELVPVAVPLALEPEEEEAVAEASEEAEVPVAEAVALALPLLAVDEAVPVESAPVLDAEAVDEPDAVADAEEEEDEPESEDSVTLNWFYTTGSCQRANSTEAFDTGFSSLPTARRSARSWCRW